MVLDFTKLSREEVIAGFAGVALLVVLLAIKWYGIKSRVVTDPVTYRTDVVETATRNAFQSFTVIDLVLLSAALSGIGLAWGAAAELDSRRLSTLAVLVAVLGLGSIALVAFRLVDPPDLELAVELQTIGAVDPPSTLHVSDFPDSEVTRKIGAWLGLAAAIPLACAGLIEVRRLRAAED